MTRTTTHFDKASEIHISEGEALRHFAPEKMVLSFTALTWRVRVGPLSLWSD
jgi:hypothetical protein